MNDSHGLRIRVAQEEDFPAWQRFVDAMPNASCMHHAGWFHILRDAYAVQPVFLIATDADDAPCGILPLYFSRSCFTGPHLSTLEDGVLARTDAATHALFTAAVRLRDEIGAKYLQVRGGPVVSPGEREVRYLHTVVETCQDTDKLWEAVKRKTRWGIRQAEKQGVHVVFDSKLDQLGTFYRLYAEHMRDLGTPVMGMRAFRAMRERLGCERLRLYLLSLGNRVIGGMLCVVNFDRWTDYYAIARHADEAEFANYLLYWHVIRDAAACGVPKLDLGRSAPGSNVYMFKRKWGGVDVEVPYHFYAAKSALRRDMGLEQMKQQKSVAQKLWSHLPLAVSNSVGPLLRRQLPFI